MSVPLMRPQTFQPIALLPNLQLVWVVAVVRANRQGVGSDGVKHKTAPEFRPLTSRSLNLGTGSETTPFTTTNSTWPAGRQTSSTLILSALNGN